METCPSHRRNSCEEIHGPISNTVNCRHRKYSLGRRVSTSTGPLHMHAAFTDQLKVTILGHNHVLVFCFGFHLSDWAANTPCHRNTSPGMTL
ncbi:hypothetical protein BABINDRAFT_162232 [Babjeviella inositovora NRRL Y-12698]|uniref:Uncharacterized protein n=1 Tax=Babjeviella inositovora NRRL Y-12698 TaxID=984486 RepID=A0A1E3QQ44_9ASCO|nr:uncharacterized protein BABINDRAFT_162232 [Babjeviella inositovora NRRL Y-12698]ODQ79192.1 hypothetical protein BABINDRAFT_162232 [Babjeviella inositovora NRRL Y-12698]